MGRSRLGRPGVRGGHSLKDGARVWRVGYFKAPLEYPPFKALSWSHRFDDPLRKFQTLYCAQHRLTALRERLQEFSPDIVTIRDFTRVMRVPLPPELYSMKQDWREEHALTPASVEIHSGHLVRLDQLSVRSRLELEHLDLLARLGIRRLDISTIRSKDQRTVTQTIARSLYDKGAAGIVYRSNLDNLLCLALFEGRARLRPAGDPELLSNPVPGLDRVCRDLHLVNPDSRRLKIPA